MSLCGNGLSINAGIGLVVQQLYQSVAGGGASADDGPIRMLSPTQKAVVESVFGKSLDVSKIFISNKTGAQNRPFTVAFPDQGQTVQIMNLGTFTPNGNLLIHELTHVWQSQHHTSPYQFMKNSVASQAIAATANAAEIFSDPDVVLHYEYPGNYPYSAYCYSPSQPFTALAAEQMAQNCELEVEGVVRKHVKTISMNVVDPDLVTAIGTSAIGDRRISGNKI